jgi:hypothetical protein
MLSDKMISADALRVAEYLDNRVETLLREAAA